MRKLAITAFILLIVTCGCVISPRRTVNSTGGGGGSNSEFSLSANPTTQVITAGASASYTINVQAVNGFTGTVSLSSSSSNSNIVTSFDNTTITGGSGTAVLTAATTSATPSGAATITVTAADTNGGASQNVSVTATVQGGAATAGAMIAQAPVLPAQCVNSSASSIAQRVSFPAAPATSGFTATFAATPSSAAIDASLGFFSPASGGQTVLLPKQLSSLINFSPTGVIQARDGDSFAPAIIPYLAGETFQFRLVENLPAATYSVFVMPPGATEVPLGTNLQVPSDQRGATTLSGWGIVVSAPQSATLSVCNFRLL
jgi:hypothetical protein